MTELVTLFEMAVSTELKECLDLSRWQGDLNHTYINESSPSILLNCSHSQQEYYIAFHVKLYCRRLARNVVHKSMFRWVCLIEWASNGAKVRFYERAAVLREHKTLCILIICRRCCCSIVCFIGWTQWVCFLLRRKLVAHLWMLYSFKRKRTPHKQSLCSKCVFVDFITIQKVYWQLAHFCKLPNKLVEQVLIKLTPVA